MFTVLWLSVIALCTFHYFRSQEYRKNVLKSNIDLITQNILTIYDDGDINRAEKFLEFIDSYYINTDYDDVSIAIYDVATGEQIGHAGFPLPPPDRSLSGNSGVFKATDFKTSIDSEGNPIDFSRDKVFYYRIDTTADGRILVQTVMPFTSAIKAPLTYSFAYTAVIIIAAIVITIFMWVFISHLSKNIVLLRDFVTSAVNDEGFNKDVEFPSDELGDISRQIIEFYQIRSRALEAIEREHRIALKATEDKSKMKRQMSDNINHELKTPIGIIKGYVDTMIENPDMDEQTKHHFLTKTSQQVTRLTEMLNDISTITRLEEAGSSIPVEKIDFHDVVFTTANDVVESGLNGTMELEYDIPFDSYIKGNFNLLAEVLTNLTKNAVAYSGGSLMGIKMIAKNKHFYTFSFYDNGKGIDPEHLPHIFDRFYRVDSGRSRKKGGTGLGLPIVKNTIITLGGTISVRNRKGGGLEFIFTLPVWND